MLLWASWRKVWLKYATFQERVLFEVQFQNAYYEYSAAMLNFRLLWCIIYKTARLPVFLCMHIFSALLCCSLLVFSAFGWFGIHMAWQDWTADLPSVKGLFNPLVINWFSAFWLCTAKAKQLIWGQRLEKTPAAFSLGRWHYKLCSHFHPLFSMIYLEGLDQQFGWGALPTLKRA